MKKKGKVLFALAMMFVMVGVVCAANRVIDKTTTLEYNKTVSGQGMLGVDFKTGLEDIKVSGGISTATVETKLQKKILGIWTTSGTTKNALNKDSTSSVETYWGNNKEVLTKVIWKNLTSYSTIKANFFAENN